MSCIAQDNNSSAASQRQAKLSMYSLQFGNQMSMISWKWLKQLQCNLPQS